MAIGKWRVVSHRFGGIISYGIMIQKGTVISRTTVQRLTNLEKEADEFKSIVSDFDTNISRRFKDEEDFFMMDQSQILKTGPSILNTTRNFRRSLIASSTNRM